MVFDVSKSYAEVLAKIGLFTCISLIISWKLVMNMFPDFDLLINVTLKNLNLDGTIKIASFELNWGLIVPGLLAIIARMIRFHDRVSDIFKIRVNYDINNILVPLAIGSGYQIKSVEDLKTKRKDLMNKVFYKYVSSDNPAIDKHLVREIMDSLSWYWIILESLCIFIITLMVSLLSNNILIIKVLIVIIIVESILYVILKKRCSKNTKNEVDAILADINRKHEINGVLNNAL